MNARTVGCTIAALFAFAGNSVLCRLALGGGAIDAASFTAIRLLSGAAALAVLSALTAPARVRRPVRWAPALILIVYAVPFSFAYVSLTAGTGALILFGTVQITMFGVAVVSGIRPHPLQWGGLATALGGLVYLVLPGLAAPPLAGAALMAVAGVAWAFYTLSGRGSRHPIDDTAATFVRAVPFAVALLVSTVTRAHVNEAGAALAVASGAATTGLGYVVWYTALRGLSAVQASVVQLLVPIIAASVGVVFLGEVLTMRLALASALVLGGIVLGLAGRERQLTVGQARVS